MTGLLTWLIFPESLKQHLLLYETYKFPTDAAAHLLCTGSSWLPPNRLCLQATWPYQLRACICTVLWPAISLALLQPWCDLVSQGPLHRALLCNTGNPTLPTGSWDPGVSPWRMFIDGHQFSLLVQRYNFMCYGTRWARRDMDTLTCKCILSSSWKARFCFLPASLSCLPMWATQLSEDTLRGKNAVLVSCWTSELFLPALSSYPKQWNVCWHCPGVRLLAF